MYTNLKNTTNTTTSQGFFLNKMLLTKVNVNSLTMKTFVTFKLILNYSNFI